MAEHKLRIDVEMNAKGASKSVKKLSDSIEDAKTSMQAAFILVDYKASEAAVQKLYKLRNTLEDKAESNRTKKLSKYYESQEKLEQAYQERRKAIIAVGGFEKESGLNALERSKKDAQRRLDIKYADQLDELKQQDSLVEKLEQLTLKIGKHWQDINAKMKSASVETEDAVEYESALAKAVSESKDALAEAAGVGRSNAYDEEDLDRLQALEKEKEELDKKRFELAREGLDDYYAEARRLENNYQSNVQKAKALPGDESSKEASVSLVQEAYNSQMDALNLKYSEVLEKQRAYMDRSNEIVIEQNEIRAAIAGVAQEEKEVAQETEKTESKTRRTEKWTTRVRSSWSAVRKTIADVAKSAISKLGKGISSAAKHAKDIGSKIKQATKPAENLRKKFTKIGLAMLGARSAFFMFKQIISEAMSNNKELQDQLQATKGVMGEALAPAIQLLVNALGKVVTFADRVYQLFTGTSLIAKYNAKQAQKQADATKDAAENAKEYQKQMASFDVANKLSDNSSSSSSASSGGSTDDSAIKFNEVDVDGWLEDILKKIKTKDWTGVGSTIAEKIVSGLNSIDWQSIREKASGAAKGFAEMLNGLFEFTSEDGSTLMSSIGKTIGESLNTVVGAVLSFAENLHWGTLGSELSNGIVTALKTIDWYKLFDTATELGTGVAEWINGVFDFGQKQQDSLAMNLSKGISNALHSAFLAVNSFLGTLDWGKIGLSIAQFIQNINWVQLFSDLAETLSEAAKGVLETVIGFFEGMDWGKMVDDIFLSILAFVRKFDWSGIASDLARLLGDLFGAVFRISVTIIQDTIASIMNIGQIIKNYFDEHIQDAKDSGGSVAQGILTGIVDIFSDIGNWIVNNIFKPFIDGFKSAFGIHSPSKEMQPLGANIWNGVLEGIKNLVSLDKLKSWWQENVVAKVQNAWATVVSVTAEIGGKIKDSFSNLKKKWDSIKNKSNTATGSGSIKDSFTKLKKKWDSIKNKTKKATATGTQKKSFKDMKKKFDGVKNKTVEITAKLKDAITGALNSMISKINNLIAKLRKISIAGYKPFKDIRDIPKLARGGIVNNPGRGVQATIGEAGREAVLPLDKNTGWMDMLAERLAQRVNGSGQMVQTIITLDGETIAKKVVEVNNRKRVRLNGGLV
nr:MAG TPA: chromosome segregation ATPase [Caudoviricetes sp.]